MKRNYFYLLGLRLLTPVGRLIFWVRYKGTKNIPKGGKYIVCSNHKSVYDPFLLAIPFYRQIRYMAKTELFTDHGFIARWVLYALGAFPVKRGSSDIESVRKAENILNDGGILGIFPQGGCVFDDSPFSPKGGAALIAAKAGTPILPAAICCRGRIRPFKRVTIRFGQTIRCEEFPVKNSGKPDIRELAAMLSKRINELLGAEN